MNNKFKNLFYYLVGLFFLFLARIKVFVQGYSTPKPYSIDEYERCVAYDIGVVDKWVAMLKEYVKDTKGNILENKTVLELGPGSDLGVGLYLLSKKVKEYISVDVNNLIKNVPKQFYTTFFSSLQDHNNETYDISFLKE
jgi:hypothetical protein